MSWFWLNVPLAVAFFAAWTGIPMWLVLRHPDQGHAAVTRAPARSGLAAPAEQQITRAPERSKQLAGV